MEYFAASLASNEVLSTSWSSKESLKVLKNLLKSWFLTCFRIDCGREKKIMIWCPSCASVYLLCVARHPPWAVDTYGLRSTLLSESSWCYARPGYIELETKLETKTAQEVTQLRVHDLRGTSFRFWLDSLTHLFLYISRHLLKRCIKWTRKWNIVCFVSAVDCFQYNFYSVHSHHPFHHHSFHFFEGVVCNKK